MLSIIFHLKNSESPKKVYSTIRPHRVNHLIMTVTIKEFSNFEAVGETHWIKLFAQCPSATVFQSWLWLTAWQETFRSGNLWLVTAWEQSKLVAAAALHLDRNGTLKFLGDGHVDYGQFLVANDNANYINALVEYIFSVTDKWKHAEFNCIPSESALARALQRKGAWQRQKIPSPRVLFEARSAESLLSKNSLKRHAKKLSALGRVEVGHFQSGKEILPYMDAFFRQHQERWALTSTPSLFSNPANREFYRALVSKASPEGPVCFTVILLDGKPAAMHLGFISQHHLIWYKPTYDPRLSSVGPGEVLIAELIKRARDKQLHGIDFTRGGEDFKLRFCSEVRHVVNFDAARNFWSRHFEVSSLKLRGAIISAIDLARLHEPVAAVAHNTKATIRLIRAKGLTTACKEIKNYIQEHGTRNVDIFIGDTAFGNERDERILVQALATLEEILDTFDTEDADHLEVLSNTLPYLAAGGRLWTAKHRGEIVSCGWELPGPEVDIMEIKARLNFPSSVVCLLAFRTFKKHQRRGYYTSLLRGIKCSGSERHLLIYALSNNVSSVKAIKNAGFAHVGRITRSYFGKIRLKLLHSTLQLSVATVERKRNAN